MLSQWHQYGVEFNYNSLALKEKEDLKDFDKIQKFDG